jgi:hypothetical protein
VPRSKLANLMPRLVVGVGDVAVTDSVAGGAL